MQDAKIQIEDLQAERDAARQAADTAAKRAEQALEAEKRAAEALQGRLGPGSNVYDLGRAHAYAVDGWTRCSDAAKINDEG